MAESNARMVLRSEKNRRLRARNELYDACGNIFELMRNELNQDEPRRTIVRGYQSLANLHLQDLARFREEEMEVEDEPYQQQEAQKYQKLLAQFQELKSQHPKILNQVDGDPDPEDNQWEEQRRTAHPMANIEVDLGQRSQFVMETGTKAKMDTRAACKSNPTTDDDPIQEDLFEERISKDDSMASQINVLMREMREMKLQLQETTQRTQRPIQATLPQPSRPRWHDEHSNMDVRTKPTVNQSPAERSSRSSPLPLLESIGGRMRTYPDFSNGWMFPEENECFSPPRPPTLKGGSWLGGTTEETARHVGSNRIFKLPRLERPIFRGESAKAPEKKRNARIQEEDEPRSGNQMILNPSSRKIVGNVLPPRLDLDGGKRVENTLNTRQEIQGQILAGVGKPALPTNLEFSRNRTTRPKLATDKYSRARTKAPKEFRKTLPESTQTLRLETVELFMDDEQAKLFKEACLRGEEAEKIETAKTNPELPTDSFYSVMGTGELEEASPIVKPHRDAPEKRNVPLKEQRENSKNLEVKEELKKPSLRQKLKGNAKEEPGFVKSPSYQCLNQNQPELVKPEELIAPRMGETFIKKVEEPTEVKAPEEKRNARMQEGEEPQLANLTTLNPSTRKVAGNGLPPRLELDGSKRMENTLKTCQGIRGRIPAEGVGKPAPPTNLEFSKNCTTRPTLAKHQFSKAYTKALEELRKTLPKSMQTLQLETVQLFMDHEETKRVRAACLREEEAEKIETDKTTLEYLTDPSCSVACTSKLEKVSSLGKPQLNAPKTTNLPLKEQRENSKALKVQDPLLKKPTVCQELERESKAKEETGFEKSPGHQCFNQDQPKLVKLEDPIAMRIEETFIKKIEEDYVNSLQIKVNHLENQIKEFEGANIGEDMAPMKVRGRRIPTKPVQDIPHQDIGLPNAPAPRILFTKKTTATDEFSFMETTIASRKPEEKGRRCPEYGRRIPASKSLECNREGQQYPTSEEQRSINLQVGETGKTNSNIPNEKPEKFITTRREVRATGASKVHKESLSETEEQNNHGEMKHPCPAGLASPEKTPSLMTGNVATGRNAQVENFNSYHRHKKKLQVSGPNNLHQQNIQNRNAHDQPQSLRRRWKKIKKKIEVPQPTRTAHGSFYRNFQKWNHPYCEQKGMRKKRKKRTWIRKKDKTRKKKLFARETVKMKKKKKIINKTSRAKKPKLSHQKVPKVHSSSIWKKYILPSIKVLIMKHWKQARSDGKRSRAWKKRWKIFDFKKRAKPLEEIGPLDIHQN